MSAETLEWLNRNVLVGFTTKRGTAWHSRASEQEGLEPNHYEGAIPVEDVRRRLFHWTPVEGDVTSTYVTSDGVVSTVTDPDRKTIIRPDTNTILGVFKAGYQIHGYEEWLVHNVERLLDADLAIGSAGLLRGGAVAWVQTELEDTIGTPEGVEFRPFLSAATSLDGTLASTYQTGATVVVCDNTLSASLGEASALRVKVKHSKKSLHKLHDVRDALQIVHSVADDFTAQVKTLCETTVTDAQWRQFLDAHVPVPQEQGRGRTIAEHKREDLGRLWVNDDRVSPWKGTAYGVLAASNTWVTHESVVRGGERAERNAHRTITGGVDAYDRQTLDTLELVLAASA